MPPLDYKSAGLRGEMLERRSLAGMNSWHVGGDAEYFYTPADREDLAGFLRFCPDETPITMLGLGSNTLVRDGGVGGVVISLRKAFDKLGVDENGLHAEAGVACAKVSRLGAREGLQGLEFMAGIPGTVGGALAMNAGAYGAETWDLLLEVEVVGRDGVIRRRPPGDYEIAYRSVRLKDAGEEWFLCGWFAPSPGGDPADLEEKLRALLKRRREEQPTSHLSCGSVFRNPDDDSAGRLIERCGLKEYAIGDAQVSSLHANFIINRGKAKACEIESLIEYVRDRVEEETGVRLEPEVRIIGERGERGGRGEQA